MADLTGQTPPRPWRLTPEMAQRAATALVADLIAKGRLRESERNDAIRGIAGHGKMFMDGYHLARELERYDGWNCNLEMAEALDNWSLLADEEIKAAQKEWAEANNIQPPFPIGARVIARWGGQDHPGTIDEVYGHGVAQFCVKADGEPGTRRMIVNFEDVRIAEPVHG